MHKTLKCTDVLIVVNFISDILSTPSPLETTSEGIPAGVIPTTGIGDPTPYAQIWMPRLLNMPEHPVTM